MPLFKEKRKNRDEIKRLSILISQLKERRTKLFDSKTEIKKHDAHYIKHKLLENINYVKNKYNIDVVVASDNPRSVQIANKNRNWAQYFHTIGEACVDGGSGFVYVYGKTTFTCAKCGADIDKEDDLHNRMLHCSTCDRWIHREDNAAQNICIKGRKYVLHLLEKEKNGEKKSTLNMVINLQNLTK